MKGKEPKMLTTREVADALGAAESSVRMWARTGRFPGAREESSPRGSYWLIPNTSLESFNMKKAGRPVKARESKEPKKAGRPRKLKKEG